MFDVEHNLLETTAVLFHLTLTKHDISMASKEQRSDHILEMVDLRHFMSIGDLAKALDVSEMTIRRDVRDLADAGKVRTVYGGVASLDNGSTIANYTHRLSALSTLKKNAESPLQRASC